MKKIIDSVVVALASCFYVGFLPLIPGTFGSAAGIIFYYLLKDNPVSYILVTLIIIVLGFSISGRAEKALNKKDAKPIVIDEVSGMLLSLMLIPYDVKFVIIGFFLFRLLDTLKPYPAGSFEKNKGSLGIMSDDLIAAIYVNIILQVVLKFAVCKTS